MGDLEAKFLDFGLPQDTVTAFIGHAMERPQDYVDLSFDSLQHLFEQVNRMVVVQISYPQQQKILALYEHALCSDGVGNEVDLVANCHEPEDIGMWRGWVKRIEAIKAMSKVRNLGGVKQEPLKLTDLKNWEVWKKWFRSLMHGMYSEDTWIPLDSLLKSQADQDAVTRPVDFEDPQWVDLEDCLIKTTIFDGRLKRCKDDNARLWEELNKSVTPESSMASHIREFQRTRNGVGAWRALCASAEGGAAVMGRIARSYGLLDNNFFKGGGGKYTFDQFKATEVENHGILKEEGEPVPVNKQITDLMKKVTDPRLMVAKNIIMSEPKYNTDYMAALDFMGTIVMQSQLVNAPHPHRNVAQATSSGRKNGKGKDSGKGKGKGKTTTERKPVPTVSSGIEYKSGRWIPSGDFLKLTQKERDEHTAIVKAGVADGTITLKAPRGKDRSIRTMTSVRDPPSVVAPVTTTPGTVPVSSSSTTVTTATTPATPTIYLVVQDSPSATATATVAAAATVPASVPTSTQVTPPAIAAAPKRKADNLDGGSAADQFGRAAHQSLRANPAEADKD
jgi:hypothetical protein